VAFIVIMTAWGWFPDDPHLSIVLGTSLFLGMLLLALPFVQQGTTTRLALFILMTLGVLFLVVVIVDLRWELGVGHRLMERLIHWLGPR
jgi:hypothetical protein